MVFTVAYGLNFASDGVCSASVYHYYVFVNVVLMSCASSILAIIVLPNYWKTPMSAVVRLAATAAVFFFALQLVIKQQQGLNHLPEKYPDNNSQDSFLLLPAMCFLDTSFDVTVNMEIPKSWEAVTGLFNSLERMPGEVTLCLYGSSGPNMFPPSILRDWPWLTGLTTSRFYDATDIL